MAPVRTLLIGDVHGCLDELQSLIHKAALAPGDRVVLLGDLVAKGPDSVGVVQYARESGFDAVLGNHDGHVLVAWDGPHARIKEALGAEDRAWLEARPLTLHLASHDVIAVHAGLVPGVPIEAQKRENLLTMRSLRPDGTGSKRAKDGVPWAELWPGPAHVVFGHDAVLGLQRHPHATGLDTGCVYGHELTGLLLPEWRFISVPARRVWATLPD